MGKGELNRVRKIAMAFPEVTERFSHGSECFYVRDKKAFCYFHETGFHEEGSRVNLWCPSPDGVPDELVASDSNRFFRPTPSASGIFSDWIGVYLDSTTESKIDWAEVSGVLEDAYRKVAPKKLVNLLDE